MFSNPNDRLLCLHHEATGFLEGEIPAYDPRIGRFVSEGKYEETLRSPSFAYYLYLRSLVEQTRPKTILELGTCEGTSAMFMLLALPEGSRLVTVDVERNAGKVLGPCLDDPRLTVLVGDDLDLRTFGDLDFAPIDLLYADTGHNYEQASREWAIYRRFLAPDGLAVFDDIHLYAGMDRFWAELPEPKLDAGARIHYSGFGIKLGSGLTAL